MAGDLAVWGVDVLEVDGRGRWRQVKFGVGTKKTAVSTHLGVVLEENKVVNGFFYTQKIVCVGKKWFNGVDKRKSGGGNGPGKKLVGETDTRLKFR